MIPQTRTPTLRADTGMTYPTREDHVKHFGGSAGTRYLPINRAEGILVPTYVNGLEEIFVTIDFPTVTEVEYPAVGRRWGKNSGTYR